jgi:hypothetical protein
MFSLRHTVWRWNKNQRSHPLQVDLTPLYQLSDGTISLIPEPQPDSTTMGCRSK